MGELTPDSIETRALLDRVRTGDRRAFEQLFAEHRAELARFISMRMDHRLRSRVDASDVVQETQLEAFRRLKDFLVRNPMPFRLWLRKTAYERLGMLRRRHLQAEQRAVGREIGLPDRSSLQLAQRLVASGLSPSQEVGRREQAARIRQALAQLSDGDGEILFMRNFEGLAYEEIACILEIDAAAARKRHGRALLRLHQVLAESSE